MDPDITFESRRLVSNEGFGLGTLIKVALPGDYRHHYFIPERLHL